MYALIAVLAWGLAPVFDKFLARELSPWTIVLLRSFVAMIVIAIYAISAGALTEVRELSDKSVPLWMIVGGVLASALLGSLIGQLAYYYAMSGADASRVVPITSRRSPPSPSTASRSRPTRSSARCSSSPA